MDFGPAWHIVDHTVHADFRAASFTAAGAFVAAVGAAADAADHHPEIAMRHPGIVHIEMTSHDVHRLTARDERLASTVDRLAAEHGIEAAR